jgi:hypothetical protein
VFGGVNAAEGLRLIALPSIRALTSETTICRSVGENWAFAQTNRCGAGNGDHHPACSNRSQGVSPMLSSNSSVGLS